MHRLADATDKSDSLEHDRRICQNASMSQPRRPVQGYMWTSSSQGARIFGQNLAVVWRMDHQCRHIEAPQELRADEMAQPMPGNPLDLAVER